MPLMQHDAVVRQHVYCTVMPIAHLQLLKNPIDHSEHNPTKTCLIFASALTVIRLCAQHKVT